MTGSARASFVTAATALALHKGGMTLCGCAIIALSDALDAFPDVAPGDDVALAHARAREVVAARLYSNETAFGAAKYALEVEMAALWSLRVQAHSKGGA
ncbi:hypothetical protein [Salipiger sp. PrR007]|uniref:hypothetical protein n=1 Tax=Salipiger sp. PrR007 TaxID=2706884 RepID=UPI0013B73FF0|nr:hypothetical protein [Salipiger sp. PrR007]NDW33805.1 hypothetical protein [Salipiger sp. PrR007]